MSSKELVTENTTFKKFNGVVYTPSWIVKLILDKLDYNNNIYNKKIVDPACGEGAFLTVVLERFIKNAISNKKITPEIKKLLTKNIYGFDIDRESVDICNANLQNIASRYNIENINWNIFATDSLDKQNVENF